MKQCSKCKQTKELSLFIWRNCNSKTCIDCHKAQIKVWGKKYHSTYIVPELSRQRNRDYAKNRRAEGRSDDKEYMKKYLKSYGKKPEVKEYRRNWYQANRERILAKQKRKRPELRAYELNRVKTNIQYKLRRQLRSRMRDAVKYGYKSGSAVSDLGCAIEEFKIYLEGKFTDGMNWGNWNHRGWHIDHIEPLSKFDLTDREQFLKAAHFTNLQPLWAEDNYLKGRYKPD